MIIREIQEKDANDVKSLIYQLKHWILSTNEVVEIIKDYKNDNYKAFVAEIDNKVVGLVAISITISFVRIAKYCRIMALIVNESCRNRNIGKKLMLHAEEFAKSSNCIWIDLTSNKKREAGGTLRFYESIGFKNVGISETNYLKKEPL